MTSAFSVQVDLDLSLGNAEVMDSLQSRLQELATTIGELGGQLSSAFSRGFGGLTEEISAMDRQLNNLTRSRTVRLNIVSEGVSGAMPSPSSSGGRSRLTPSQRQWDEDYKMAKYEDTDFNLRRRAQERAYRDAEREKKARDRSFDRTYDAAERENHAYDRRQTGGSSSHSLMGGIADLTFAGFGLKALGDAIGNLAERADKAQQEVTKLQLTGVAPEEAQKIRRNAVSIANRVYGADDAEIMAVHRKIAGQVGNENVSDKSVEIMATAANALKRIGLHEDPEEVFRNLSKVAFQMGVKDSAGNTRSDLVEKQLGRASTIMIASAGDVSSATLSHNEQTLAPYLKNSGLSEAQQDALMGTVSLQGGAELGQKFGAAFNAVQGGSLATNDKFMAAITLADHNMIRPELRTVMSTAMGGRSVNDSAVLQFKGANSLEQMVTAEAAVRKSTQLAYAQTHGGNMNVPEAEYARQNLVIFGKELGEFFNQYVGSKGGFAKFFEDQEKAQEAVRKIDLNTQFHNLSDATNNMRMKFDMLVGSTLKFGNTINLINALANGMGRAASFMNDHPAVGSAVSTGVEAAAAYVGLAILKFMASKIGPMLGIRTVAAGVGLVGASAGLAGGGAALAGAGAAGLLGGFGRFVVGAIALQGVMSLFERFTGSQTTQNEAGGTSQSSHQDQSWGSFALELASDGLALSYAFKFLRAGVLGLGTLLGLRAAAPLAEGAIRNASGVALGGFGLKGIVLSSLLAYGASNLFSRAMGTDHDANGKSTKSWTDVASEVALPAYLITKSLGGLSRVGSLLLEFGTAVVSILGPAGLLAGALIGLAILVQKIFDLKPGTVGKGAEEKRQAQDQKNIPEMRITPPSNMKTFDGFDSNGLPAPSATIGNQPFATMRGVESYESGLKAGGDALNDYVAPKSPSHSPFGYSPYAEAARDHHRRPPPPTNVANAIHNYQHPATPARFHPQPQSRFSNDQNSPNSVDKMPNLSVRDIYARSIIIGSGGAGQTGSTETGNGAAAKGNSNVASAAAQAAGQLGQPGFQSAPGEPEVTGGGVSASQGASPGSLAAQASQGQLGQPGFQSAPGEPDVGSPASGPARGPSAAPAIGNLGGSFAEKAPKVVDQLMKDFNLTKAQAAGIVGNLGHESGLQGIQEKGKAPGTGGFGWAQWTGPRRAQFLQYAAANNLDPKSDAANYGFLRQELRTTERGSLAAIRQTNTVHGAAQAFERSYERAGIVNMASRDRYADSAMAASSQAVPKADSFQGPQVNPNDYANQPASSTHHLHNVLQVHLDGDLLAQNMFSRVIDTSPAGMSGLTDFDRRFSPQPPGTSIR